MRISDWSSDVCSSDLPVQRNTFAFGAVARQHVDILDGHIELVAAVIGKLHAVVRALTDGDRHQPFIASDAVIGMNDQIARSQRLRSEEHTSELQSLMRISYAVFCLKQKTKHTIQR